MAAVYDSVCDFVLFPRDQVYPDFIAQQSTDNFDGFNLATIAMDHHPQFAAPAKATYDSYLPTSAYAASSAYYEAPNPRMNSTKVGDEMSMPRPTPSASPSSMSQTFDHPPSILSSASGASAQSAASSVGGSPYAQPLQQIPFQDKWSNPHGLGISPSGASGDLFSHDPSYHGFVGEYRDSFSSLLPSTRSLASSISLAPAAQENPSAFSPLLPESSTAPRTKEMRIDTILREINRTSTTSAPAISPASSTSTTCPSSVFQENTHGDESPTDHRLCLPPLRSPTPATPQPSFTSPPPSAEPYVGQDITVGSFAPPSNSHASFRLHQGPFFGQSSGRFVAPLQSSCWFSLTSVRAFEFTAMYTLQCA